MRMGNCSQYTCERPIAHKFWDIISLKSQAIAIETRICYQEIQAMTKPGVRDVEACELCALSASSTAVINLLKLTG